MHFASSRRLNLYKYAFVLPCPDCTAVSFEVRLIFVPILAITVESNVGSREVTGFLLNTLDIISLKTRGTGMTGYPTPPMCTMLLLTEPLSTRHSRYYLVIGHGYHPPAGSKTHTPRCNYVDYVSELRGRKQAANAIARDRLVESRTRSKLDYDRKTVQIALKVGDRALLFGKSVRRERSIKLNAQWIGPYIVLAVDGVNATIKCGRNIIKVHVNRLKPFY